MSVGPVRETADPVTLLIAEQRGLWPALTAVADREGARSFRRVPIDLPPDVRDHRDPPVIGDLATVRTRLDEQGSRADRAIIVPDIAPTDGYSGHDLVSAVTLQTSGALQGLDRYFPELAAIVLVTSQGHLRARSDAAELLDALLDGQPLTRWEPVLDDPWEGYYYAKFAIVELARRWCVHFARRGTRINVVSPSLVAIEQFERALARYPERVGGLVARMPLGRVAHPEEVVEVVRFLASPQSSFVTGAVVPVDGGSAIAGLHPADRPEQQFGEAFRSVEQKEPRP